MFPAVGSVPLMSPSPVVKTMMMVSIPYALTQFDCNSVTVSNANCRRNNVLKRLYSPENVRWAFSCSCSWPS